MLLKKLELFGFKSFADKTYFEFGRGINGIVGPNGCGKSNVVDAFKWVLGEQSAKSLRGNEMLDVVFSGTNSRPSMGYAEASLTFLNDKDLLPVEYNEVCITRRLYAAGESEYLINKQPCRLKDIKELFLGTGVGGSCYSIMEQGKIESLLQVNAQERRFVFEEAAGISKYKAKKRETVLKLEKVEQNLLRVNDIVEEVQKQLRSIKLQAAKARKYNERVVRLKELRIKLSLKKYITFKDEREIAQEQIQQAEGRCQEALTIIEDLNGEKDSLQNSINELASSLEKCQINLASLAAKITGAHDRIGFNHNTIEDLNIQKDKHEKSIDILKNKIEYAERDISELNQDLEKIQKDLTEGNSSLSTKETALKQYVYEYDILEQQIEDNKKQVIDMLHRGSSLQNEVGSLSAERETIGNRRSKLLKRQEEISSELERIEYQRRSLTEQRDRVLSKIEGLELSLVGTNEQIKVLNSEIQTIGDSINDSRQLQGRKESRLETLEDLEKRFEGVSSGVQVVLEESGKDNGVISGVYGMVADLIKVDTTYVSAIETVLGDRAQIIVVNSIKDVIQASGFLKEQDKGYVKFLPLEDIRVEGGHAPIDLNIPGVVGRAVDLIKSEDRFKPLVEYILRDTIVVDDFDTALRISGERCGAKCIVTLNGEVVEPGGTILVGRGDMKLGLISRKSELESIKLELANILRVIETRLGEKEIKESEVVHLTQNADEFKRGIDAENSIKISQESNLQKEEFKNVELNDEQGVNESEIQEINEHIENINRREANLNSEIADLNDHRKVLEEQVVVLEGDRIHKESGKVNVQNEITELKVVLAQKEERNDNLIASIDKLKKELVENKEGLTAAYSEINNCREKTIVSENMITDLNNKLEELQSEKLALENEGVRLREKQDVCNGQLTEKIRQVDEYNEEYKNHEHAINDLRLKENEFKIKVIDLEERIRDDYQVELSQFAIEHNDEDDGSLDWDNVSREIDELKSKVDKMGSVNLEAIHEQTELEERETHLANQVEDLQTSEKDLNDIINKINVTSRELFETTFHEIRNHFLELFRKLFGGGRADIVLEEGVDILDAGIDIIAQPPGKDLKSIMLFSGGEKVMTTIALLFAIFQSKPSPFCLLDEVDAALDENNITRFIQILKEFASESQFVVITHSKQTMTIADVIYGVTMEEAGVSKKISVKFEEVEKQVA
ncbi:ATPases [Candidatus Scalindua japonica]|uniref:Chromosome partition protein Smc n=1 Tax=Candidatus Scalindua japonica TaxID=1284222 RepID=A0A286TW75_9BACT|nr:chromosome segregation protein SMC [Candidatus Scalindua japonica]GAX60104.1 ATPases [Candidatus Scalindua japonica]